MDSRDGVLLAESRPRGVRLVEAICPQRRPDLGSHPARALDVLGPGGILVSTQPTSLAPLAEAAAERGIRLAGIIVEADELGMSALAELAAAGKLVPTIAATFPLEEARAASAMADVAATDGRFPLEEGGATESGKHGPGKVVLTMV